MFRNHECCLQSGPLLLSILPINVTLRISYLLLRSIWHRQQIFHFFKVLNNLRSTLALVRTSSFVTRFTCRIRNILWSVHMSKASMRFIAFILSDHLSAPYITIRHIIFHHSNWYIHSYFCSA